MNAADSAGSYEPPEQPWRMALQSRRTTKIEIDPQNERGIDRIEAQISRYHRSATLVQRRSCHFGRFAPSMCPVDAIQADAIQVDAAPTASMTAERLAAQGTKTRRLPRRGGSDDPYALRAARRLSQLRMTGIAGMRQYLASSGRSVSSSGKLASHSPWRRSRPAAANSSSARWLRASK